MRNTDRRLPFPQLPNESGGMSTATLKRADGVNGGAANLVERGAPVGPAGYPSPVCSSTADAIERVATAIDQLASDARDARGSARGIELAARTAALWQMISDLDPELARRARRYAAPSGGAPSA